MIVLLKEHMQQGRILEHVFWATPHKDVCGLQPIFFAGNAPISLEIHKVFLRSIGFFRQKIFG